MGGRFEAAQPRLEAEFSPESVRALQLYLRGSELFLRGNRTQAYHLVAGRATAPLEAGSLRDPAANLFRSATPGPILGQ